MEVNPETVAICGFVFSVACGWASQVRMGKFTGLGHWCGVVSVLLLACMAWPSHVPIEHKAPVHHERFASTALQR